MAAKYLRLLRKTIFYRDWAEDAMTYLYNEEKSMPTRSGVG
ncbi:DUF6057 family protein [Bacteroides uniformis]|nr:DUF6057 family protein [Bacteroides uniformis]